MNEGRRFVETKISLIGLLFCMVLVSSGCGKVTDEQICWVQQDASIAPQTAPLNLANPMEGDQSYINIHQTTPSKNTVLYVERLRWFDKWGSQPDYAHPVKESIQMSLMIPAGVKLDASTKLAINASSGIAISRWASGFYKPGVTGPGIVDYPLDTNKGSTSGVIIGLPDGKIRGTVQFNVASLIDARQNNPIVVPKQFNFSCQLKIAPKNALQVCAGRAYAVCGETIQSESIKSEFKYCLSGFDRCHDQFGSNYESPNVERKNDDVLRH
jgi:hypothetical protein